MEAVASLVPTTGLASACRALGVPRATWYRQRRVALPAAPPAPGTLPELPAQPHPRALGMAEQAAVLEGPPEHRALAEPAGASGQQQREALQAWQA